MYLEDESGVTVLSPITTAGAACADVGAVSVKADVATDCEALAEPTIVVPLSGIAAAPVEDPSSCDNEAVAAS